MEDLILRYQFTDRAGRGVFNIHTYNDRKLGPITGQIRLKTGSEVDAPNCIIDWAEGGQHAPQVVSDFAKNL